MAKRPSLPLKIDEWDSLFFKRSIARLTISGKARRLFTPQALSDMIIRSRRRKIRYIVIKLDKPDIFCERILLRLGLKECGRSVDLKFSYVGKKRKRLFSGHGINLFEPGDLNGVKDIASDAFRRSYLYRCAFGKKSEVDRYHALWIENLSKDKGTYLFVAKENSAITGFLALKLDREKKNGRIVLIAVRKAFRGRGVGSALMHRCIDWCEGQIKTIFVKTQKNNRGALILYKKIGFKTAKYDKIFCMKI